MVKVVVYARGLKRNEILQYQIDALKPISEKLKLPLEIYSDDYSKKDIGQNLKLALTFLKKGDYFLTLEKKRISHSDEVAEILINELKHKGIRVMYYKLGRECWI